ncbi:MAG: aldehyde dehydrogenase family protein [Phycisphaerales bacterium]
MSERLDVSKTYKLFINGGFPRSESGRTLAIVVGDTTVHVARASRKDLRDAVEAARAALPKWSGATAYNRGQVLYRMAEMMEGKKRELAQAIGDVKKQRSGAATKGSKKGTKAQGQTAKSTGIAEVEAAIDRLVCFAGWADKYAQVLGCNNPVAGPYYNFTVPEPTGVVGVLAPNESPLLGLISLAAPALCAGNCVVALASEANPIPGAILGEVAATSDVPAGVLNLLTGVHEELVPQFASHREIGAIHAAGLTAEGERQVREGVADNLKRVALHPSADFAHERWRGPWVIEPLVEMKTIWHPSGV